MLLQCWPGIRRASAPSRPNGLGSDTPRWVPRAVSDQRLGVSSPPKRLSKTRFENDDLIVRLARTAEYRSHANAAESIASFRRNAHRLKTLRIAFKCDCQIRFPRFHAYLPKTRKGQPIGWVAPIFDSNGNVSCPVYPGQQAGAPYAGFACGVLVTVLRMHTIAVHSPILTVPCKTLNQLVV